MKKNRICQKVRKNEDEEESSTSNGEVKNLKELDVIEK